MPEKTAVEKDAQSLGVEATFRILFDPRDPKEFGGTAKQYSGLSDAAPGRLQWSAWYDHRKSVAMLAVNLDGMKHDSDDWPIGRLIQRELKHPKFPEVFATFTLEADVEVAWSRDAWIMYRVPIAERQILRGSAQSIDAVSWRLALVEAGACLKDGLRGRATQKVTLPHKGLRELAVSPHLQFRTPLWQHMPDGHQARAAIMQGKRELLAPLHTLAKELAK